MKQKNMKTVFSILLTILFVAACSPAPVPSTIQPPQASATVLVGETPVTPPDGVPLTETPVDGQNLCANPYYPVREGATWNYTSTGGPAGPYSFTDTITSVRADGFTLATQIGSLTPTQEWACRPEGLVALQFGGAPAAMLSAQNMQLNFDVNNASGVTFPNQINAGDQWQHTLDFAGSITAFNEQGTATGDAQNSFTAVGIESVTVPAGTFDAMRVDVNTTMNINATYEGISLPVAFSISYTYWFAPGVGWVKSTGTGDLLGTAISETTELQSYNIP